jgi:hypothetical protein
MFLLLINHHLLQSYRIVTRYFIMRVISNVVTLSHHIAFRYKAYLGQRGKKVEQIET